MSSPTIRWGIFGTGFIAGEFAKGLKFVPQAQLLGIASRTAANAQKFGEIFQISRVYDSYEQLVKDPDIDVVYIGTPNDTHKELCLMCLEAGKPVLCEKPFALNAKEASEVIELARRQNLFCMEAMWMRFMPLIQQVKRAIAEGVIGEPKMLQADFGYIVSDALRLGSANRRNSSLKSSEGVLLDRGIYGLSLAYYLLGTPSAIQTQANLNSSGVDEQSAILLNYSTAIAVLSQSLRTQTPNRAVISGTKGRIIIDELFIMPEKISLEQFSPPDNPFPSPLIPLGSKQKLAAAVKSNSLVRRLYISLSGLLKSKKVTIMPITGNGYNYEAMEVVRCLQNGQLESETMPLNETLKITEAMDFIQSQWSK